MPHCHYYDTSITHFPFDNLASVLIHEYTLTTSYHLMKLYSVLKQKYISAYVLLDTDEEILMFTVNMMVRGIYNFRRKQRKWSKTQCNINKKQQWRSLRRKGSKVSWAAEAYHIHTLIWNGSIQPAPKRWFSTLVKI